MSRHVDKMGVTYVIHKYYINDSISTFFYESKSSRYVELNEMLKRTYKCQTIKLNCFRLPLALIGFSFLKIKELRRVVAKPENICDDLMSKNRPR